MAHFGLIGVTELILLMVMGGGGNELLDYTDPATFWKAHDVPMTAEAMLGELAPPEAGDVSGLIEDLGSPEYATRARARQKLLQAGKKAIPELKKATGADDFETAMAAKAILREMKVEAGDDRLRRLMAIRTLGQLKAAGAAGALEKHLKSSDPFVRDYARRALARIEGRKVTREEPTAKDLDADLHLLPENTTLVAQTRIVAAPVDSLQDLVKGLPDLPQLQPEQIIRQVNATAATAFGKVGNVRVQAITVGVTDTFTEGPGPEGFVIVAVGRGLYDPQKVRQFLVEKEGGKAETIDGVPVVRVDDFALAMPDNRRLVLLGSPSEDELERALKGAVAAVKTGRGTLHKNEAMMTLIGKCKRTGPLWGVVRMIDAFREEKPLEPIETARLETTLEDNALAIRLVATGKDAESMAASTEVVNKGLADMKKEFDGMARMGPMVEIFKPVIDFVNSIEIERDATTITAIARLKDARGSMLAAPMLMFGGVPMGF